MQFNMYLPPMLLQLLQLAQFRMEFELHSQLGAKRMDFPVHLNLAFPIRNHPQYRFDLSGPIFRVFLTWQQFVND
jgi:hypothetical protein